MSADPNRLLFVISARGSMTWAQYREAVDYFSASGTSQERRIEGTANRSGLLQCLEALGHCDVHYAGGESTIGVTPPALCRLPRSGLPVAVLTGARCLHTYAQLADAAESGGGRVRLTLKHQPGPLGLLPDMIQVSAPSEDVMSAYCTSLGISNATILASSQASSRPYIRDSAKNSR